MREVKAPCSPPPKVVSLDLELSTLEFALKGAEILSELQAQRGLPDAEAERDAPSCVASVLALVGVRMKHLRRAVRGEEDPAHLLEAHNSTAAGELLGGEDVYLSAWGSAWTPLRTGVRAAAQKPAAKARQKRQARKADDEAPSNVRQQFVPAPT